MDTSEVGFLENFGEYLTERAECTGEIGSEDVIRYTFFHSLVSSGRYRHFDISLEEPLPYHPTRRVDTVVRNRQGERDMIVEFKYHRAKFASQPKPQLAGGLYCDLFRLAFAQAKTKARAYLIYVTDAGMAEYLSKVKHRSHDLFLLEPGASCSIGPESSVGRRKTFLKALSEFHGYPATVRCLYRRDLLREHRVIVFGITHIPAPVYEWD